MMDVVTFVEYNIRTLSGGDESLILMWGTAAAPIDISTWDFFLTVKTDAKDPDSKAAFKSNPEDCTKYSSERDEAETVDTVAIPYQASATPLKPTEYVMGVKMGRSGSIKPFLLSELVVEKDPTDRVETDA